MVVNILKINFLTPYTANCSVFRVKRPLGCQYYCKILLPLINIAQRFSLDDSVLLCNILFCSWVRTRKYVEWYWCCLCGHCFSTVFNKRKESLLDLRVVQRKTTTHTSESHGRLDAEWADRLQNSFCAIRRPNIGCDTQDCYSYNHYRNTNMPEAVSHRQRLSISYAIFPLEIILKTWNSQGLYFSQLEFLCRTRVYCSANRR